MKKFKLLTPVLGVLATSAAIIPVASCACTTTREISISDTTNANLEIKKNDASGIEIVVTVKDATKKEIQEIKVAIGNTELGTDEYTYEKDTGKIVISKETLDKYKGAVSVTVTVKDKETPSGINNMTFTYHSEEQTQDSFASDDIDVKLDKTTSYSFLMDFSLAKAKGLKLTDGWFMFAMPIGEGEDYPVVSSGRIYLKDDTTKTADLEYIEETGSWIIPFDKISATDDSKIVFEVKFEPYEELTKNATEIKIKFCVNHENGQ